MATNKIRPLTKPIKPTIQKIQNKKKLMARPTPLTPIPLLPPQKAIIAQAKTLEPLAMLVTMETLETQAMLETMVILEPLAVLVTVAHPAILRVAQNKILHR